MWPPSKAQLFEIIWKTCAECYQGKWRHQIRDAFCLKPFEPKPRIWNGAWEKKWLPLRVCGSHSPVERLLNCRARKKVATVFWCRGPAADCTRRDPPSRRRWCHTGNLIRVRRQIYLLLLNKDSNLSFALLIEEMRITVRPDKAVNAAKEAALVSAFWGILQNEFWSGPLFFQLCQLMQMFAKKYTPAGLALGTLAHSSLYCVELFLFAVFTFWWALKEQGWKTRASVWLKFLNDGWFLCCESTRTWFNRILKSSTFLIFAKYWLKIWARSMTCLKVQEFCAFSFEMLAAHNVWMKYRHFHRVCLKCWKWSDVYQRQFPTIYSLVSNCTFPRIFVPKLINLNFYWNCLELMAWSKRFKNKFDRERTLCREGQRSCSAKLPKPRLLLISWFETERPKKEQNFCYAEPFCHCVRATCSGRKLGFVLRELSRTSNHTTQVGENWTKSHYIWGETPLPSACPPI